ncbi:MAG: DUF2142 domain-containing protein [Lachnospiraceae bacterium]|nr:DUF2142 domain-containing protein [Lachnospiraceae bacterium]
MSIVDRFRKGELLSVENFFLVMALFFGLLMAVVGTPFQECDGWSHFVRAMDVSYGNVAAPVVSLNHSGGVAVAPDNFYDLDYKLTKPGSGEGYAYKNYLKGIKFSKEKMTIGFGEGIMSLFYYPQALGLFIGRILNLSVFGCVVLGRLFNLFCFVWLSYKAISITPVLKNSMVVIALFPMTIYQAASFSPDALLNGLCFLFIALCFYYAYGVKEKIGYKDALLLGFVLALIFLCKYVYVFLGLLVFLIPMHKFGDKKDYFKKFMTALIPLLLLGIIAVSAAISALSSTSPAPSEVIKDVSAPAVSTGMSTLDFLFASPLNVFKILFHTFTDKFSDYVLWLNVLGSLNYPLGPLIYIVPMFALYVFGSEVYMTGEEVKVKDKVLCGVAFLLISICVILGIYIGDTRINFAGEYVVQGVQGRYFIAALPTLAFVLVPRSRHGESKIFNYILLGVEFVILCIAIYFLRANCA